MALGLWFTTNHPKSNKSCRFDDLFSRKRDIQTRGRVGILPSRAKTLQVLPVQANEASGLQHSSFHLSPVQSAGGGRSFQRTELRISSNACELITDGAAAAQAHLQQRRGKDHRMTFL